MTTAQTEARPAADTISGARLFVRCLNQLGVDTVFGYPGGAIMPIYDALPDSGITHILTRHEQGAALAADGYARVSGRVGVCLATSGPGATNLVTGLANSFLDSVPVVAITGQVASPLMGTDAFQEVDVFGITLPVVKHSYIIRNTADIPRVLAEAFRIAREGRPGPVLIDIPKDVTVNTVDADLALPSFPARVARPAPGVDLAAQAMATAQRPLFYIGGGVEIAGVEHAMRSLVERTGFPFVSTLKALGSVPTDHPRFMGMLGMHGKKAANLAIQESDLLVVCGARFDDRATGKLEEFAPHARVIHMDGDPAEIGKLRRADIALPGDLRANLTALVEHYGDTNSLSIRPWLERCRELCRKHAWDYNAPGDRIYAPLLLKRMSEMAEDRMIISCDVGQHQMWVAQHCRFRHPRTHLTSGGLGTMGYGLPAGLGAKLANPDDTVVVVSGDGSIMMNIQELATLNRYAIDVRIVLLDNAALGMVRQWQELFFAGNYSEIDLSDNPDFAALARVFGLKARTIDQRDQVDDALDWLIHTPGPSLLHVRIDPQANVWPLVPPGANNAAMMQGEQR
ncbi:MAG: acetolactate synthase 2 catalytic subunit [Gammaproteobacteria bacterium]|jgi:acetolactate synthase-1/2/3 large subunit|nr:acetolactate synthase 2 catalytic subunit [Gammaproteobacteria bacterium]